MRSPRPLVPLLLVLALALATPPPLTAARLKMFVTSVAGAGDLSAWADAGGAEGVAAGDAICQARATAAGLSNPSAYRAWLSDDLDDAYCRLHGLAGAKADDCGEVSLPATAGPWWRTDGRPFTGKLPELLNPTFKILSPPRFDEFGAPIPPPLQVWSGTDAYGAASSNRCQNWTSAASAVSGGYGYADHSYYYWGTGWVSPCDGARRLYCFEIGSGEPLPVFPANRPLAFLSSATGYGDLSAWPLATGEIGVEAGDKVCRLLATAAGLREPATFLAWLSDTAADAPDRFVNTGPWVRLDGMLIAASLDDLLDGQIESGIDLRETGGYVLASAWTGTHANGGVCVDTCDSWRSESAALIGLTGLGNTTDSAWTEGANPRACNYTQHHLFCLQDTPLLFFDDFESGAAWAWSSRVPAP